MKNLIILILSLVAVLMISNLYSAEPDIAGNEKSNEFLLKGGVDMMGTLETEDLEDGDAEIGFSLGGEFIMKMSKEIGFGGGITYQIPRGVDETGWEDTEFNYMPIYGLFRYYIPADNLSPYLTIHLGYNLAFASDLPYDADVEGGLYYGFGGGLVFMNGFFGELLYSIDNGTISATVPYYGDIELDTKYKKFTFSVGKIF